MANGQEMVADSVAERNAHARHIRSRYPHLDESVVAMVEACESIVAYYQNMSGNPNCPIPDRYWLDGALLAREALAKAKGH